MTTFHDGPAAGQVLMLSRAPLFLRAVQSPEGEWDALDQLADRPDPTETITVYRRCSAVGRCHINRSRKAGGCAWVTIAEYRVVYPQPDDDVVRDPARWAAWATDAFAAIRAEAALRAEARR